MPASFTHFPLSFVKRVCLVLRFALESNNVVAAAGGGEEGDNIFVAAATAIVPGRFRPDAIPMLDFPDKRDMDAGASSSVAVSGRETVPCGSLRRIPIALPAGASLEGALNVGDEGGGVAVREEGLGAKGALVTLVGTDALATDTVFEGIGTGGTVFDEGADARAALIRGTALAFEAGLSEFDCCKTLSKPTEAIKYGNIP